MSTFETSSAAPAAPTIPPYSTAEMRSYPLGTLVVRAGLMSLETVNRALAQAADSGRRLGEVLLEYGLPERELTRLLAAQQGQEFVDLDAYPIDHEVAFAARSDIKDAIGRIHEPKGMITQMALAEARGEPVPTPQPAAGPVYRVEVTLESGSTLLVAEATDFEQAKAIGMRVIDEAEAGGTVAVGDATIDGRQVVSVDVLGRNAA